MIRGGRVGETRPRDEPLHHHRRFRGQWIFRPSWFHLGRRTAPFRTLLAWRTSARWRRRGEVPGLACAHRRLDCLIWQHGARHRGYGCYQWRAVHARYILNHHTVFASFKCMAGIPLLAHGRRKKITPPPLPCAIENPARLLGRQKHKNRFLRRSSAAPPGSAGCFLPVLLFRKTRKNTRKATSQSTFAVLSVFPPLQRKIISTPLKLN